jgi:Flp pilus assembly protein TadB
MMPSIAAGLAAASTLALLVAVRLRNDRVVIERAAAERPDAERADADGHRRAWKTYPALVLRRLGSISLPTAVCDRERLRRRLRLSRSIGVDVDHVVGVKLVAAAAAFLTCLMTPIAAAAPALAAAAFTLPDVVLARRVVRRTARMDDELPQLLDLLAAASHAGLGGPLALRRAVDGIRGPPSSASRTGGPMGTWIRTYIVNSQSSSWMDSKTSISTVQARTSWTGASGC